MGVCVPEEYGGAGADFVSYILVLEELSRADAGVGVTVAVHTSAVTLPILAFGTDEQRARFVPPLARGEQLGAFALTEPEAGSDAGSLRTSADGARTAGGTISGSKQFISTGGYAGTFLLFARTDPSTDGARGRLGLRARRRPRPRHARARRSSGSTRRRRVDLVVDAHVDARPAARTRRARASTSRCRRSTAAGSGSPRRRSASRRRRTTWRATTRSSGKQFGKRDRRVPGDPAQARRHVDRDRRRAPARPPGRVAEGAGPSARRGGREGEAVRVRDGAPRRPARRSRSSAATATRRSSRSSATTATRRSPRSTRGRARSSGS